MCSCLVPRLVAQLWLYYFSYEQMEKKCNQRAAELAGGVTGLQRATEEGENAAWRAIRDGRVKRRAWFQKVWGRVPSENKCRKVKKLAQLCLYTLQHTLHGGFRYDLACIGELLPEGICSPAHNLLVWKWRGCRVLGIKQGGSQMHVTPHACYGLLLDLFLVSCIVLNDKQLI